jgi:crossover junction endodeoxyribonuclease RuvC
MNDHVTILGIDPSTVCSGWCVFDLDGHVESVRATGTYEPEKGVEFDDLLVGCFHWLQGAADLYQADALAIETPFYKLNARTLIRLAGVGAAFRLAARLLDMDVHEVPPAKRCTALGMPGNASKEQLCRVVNSVYNLNLTCYDESDAVAIAAAVGLELRTAHLLAVADLEE